MPLKIFITALCSLSCVFAAAQDWGGRYKLQLPEDAEVQGDLFLVPVGPEQTEFLLTVVNKAGDTIVYDSTDGPVSLSDGKFIWRFPGGEFDYTLTMDLYPEADGGIPLENTIKVS